jgi:ribosome assembly protein 4
MWNALTGVCLRSFGNHAKCVTKLVWTGNNEIISGSEDCKISVYDSKGNFTRGMRSHSHWVNTMSLSTEHVLKRGSYDPERKFIVGEHGNKKEVALKLYQEATKVHK